MKNYERFNPLIVRRFLQKECWDAFKKLPREFSPSWDAGICKVQPDNTVKEMTRSDVCAIILFSGEEEKEEEEVKMEKIELFWKERINEIPQYPASVVFGKSFSKEAREYLGVQSGERIGILERHEKGRNLAVKLWKMTLF